MDAGLRTVRTTEERLGDALVTLAAFAKIQQTIGNHVGERLKAAKLLFLISHDLFTKRVRALHLSFYRYTYGPFTTDLYATWEELASAGYLSVDADPRGAIAVTLDGLECAERFTCDVLESRAGRAVRQAIDQVADGMAHLRTGELLDQVYAKQVTPVGWDTPTAIRDVPSGVYLTKIVERQEATEALRVPAVWIRGLQIAQMKVAAESVGHDRPVIDGLSFADALELDEALRQEEGGQVRAVDVYEEIARLRAAASRSEHGD